MPANKYTTGNNTGNVLTKVTLPGSEGTVVYYLKDTWAREQLENLTSYTKYLGVVDQETPIVDGQDTNPVSIGGVDIVPENGNIVIFGQKEFIYNGDDEIWQEFGDLSGLVDALGELAYVDTASTGYQPEGSVSAEFEGSEGTVEVSGSANLNLATGEFKGTQGTINTTGTVGQQRVKIDYTPEGELDLSSFKFSQISIDYTPEGGVTASFDGLAGIVNVSGIPQGIVQMAEIVKSLAGNYTPSGTVEVNVDLDVTSGSVNEITSVGTLPSLSISAVNMSINATDSEQLDFFFDAGLVSWNAGTLPSYTAASVVTGVAVSSATGNFSGDTVLISAAFSGSSTTFSGTFIPSGTVGATFSGFSTTFQSDVTLSADARIYFNGSSASIITTIPSQTISTTGTFTPAGSVTLASTPVSITASGSFTPAGSITNATFTGSSTTITVSADSV